MERPDATTLRRLGAIVGVVLGLAYVVAVWLASNDIRNDLLVPRPPTEGTPVEIASVGGGRIGLVRSPVVEADGVWGLRSGSSHGIVGEVVELRDDVVVRSFDAVEGAFAIGESVLWDPLVYRGDPATALGIDYEPVRIPGELGVDLAWFVDGRQDTWVIVIHGRDASLDQSLRLLPALTDADYPVVVTSWRGDGIAPDTRSGRYTWGVEEWPDVEAAVAWAQGQGARGVVVLGFGMGASITAQFLHESTLLPVVRGVVLDSPVLDLEATADRNAVASNIPGFVHGPAKAVARLRFNLEWNVLDHAARAGEFDVPILLLQAGADDFAPPAVAEEFAEDVPEGLLRYNTIEGADHETIWNTNPARYEFAVLRFLEEVTPRR